MALNSDALAKMQTRLFIILLWTFAVAVGHFPDAVASSADAAFVVFSSHASIND
jgi:hypothetical protein